MGEDGDSQDLIPLLEGLIHSAGTWEAKQLIAELPQASDWFRPLRRAGFSVIAKQRLFYIDPGSIQLAEGSTWRTWHSGDIYAMRKLYQMLVPPLIQSVEPLTRLHMLGMASYDEGGVLQAYVDLAYGPMGIWVMPFIHPQASSDPTDLLNQLMLTMPDVGQRPVAIVCRSYQPWIEAALDTMPGVFSPEQVVMVHHLAIRQTSLAPAAFKPFENGKTEPTFPVATSKTNHT